MKRLVIAVVAVCAFAVTVRVAWEGPRSAVSIEVDAPSCANAEEGCDSSWCYEQVRACNYACDQRYNCLLCEEKRACTKLCGEKQRRCNSCCLDCKKSKTCKDKYCFQ